MTIAGAPETMTDPRKPLKGFSKTREVVRTRIFLRRMDQNGSETTVEIDQTTTRETQEPLRIFGSLSIVMTGVFALIGLLGAAGGLYLASLEVFSGDSIGEHIIDLKGFKLKTVSVGLGIFAVGATITYLAFRKILGILKDLSN